MAWEQLRTDYTDRTWEGEYQKFNLLNNIDGTISLVDVTQYLNNPNSFFSALDANRMNEAINAIMAALEGGTDLYETFQQFFNTQMELFETASQDDLYAFQVYLDQLRGTANQDIAKLKSDYTAEMTQFESTQELLFTQWFDMIKGQLSDDVAGHLQNEIDELRVHVYNLAVKVRFTDTVGVPSGTAVNIRNTTTGTLYQATDFTEALHITEPGDYTLVCSDDNYMVAPTTMHIDYTDVMSTKNFRIMDGNGLAFVGGYVGAYVNQ